MRHGARRHHRAGSACRLLVATGRTNRGCGPSSGLTNVLGTIFENPQLAKLGEYDEADEDLCEEPHVVAQYRAKDQAEVSQALAADTKDPAAKTH